MDADHDYNPNCGCPGCQFMWAGEQAFKKFGSPPVIGTFTPTVGDYGRDSNAPNARLRVWLGEDWWPSTKLFPIGEPLRSPHADFIQKRLNDEAKAEKPADYQFKTKDHPEANGRIPQSGEHAYTLTFPLESGGTLSVLCGEETFTHFSNMIGSLLIDNIGDQP